MRELSIEEKAKAYDEALEKLRDFYRDYDTVSCLINVKEELANLFPELAESEDEKTRKSLIHLVHLYGGEFGMIDANTTVEKAIAWLEKRCMVIKDTISMDVNSETEWDDIHKFLRMNLDGEKVKLLIIREE